MWNSPPPTNTSKIHLHVEQFSLKTGNCHKDSCTTKAVRKIHTETGKKGKQAIRLGPVTLGGDLEEKGDYMGKGPPCRVRGSSHILDASALGSNKGKMSPLGWLEGQ